MGNRPIVVVGSGVAGSVLSRLLTARGCRVTLVERGRHPRFALGESSTPLAAISLERMAHEYGLPDLAALAAYGRWGRELPHLRRGLKRGFSFYRHRRGHAYENDTQNSNRLLVAASPDDEIADAHWLRSDVDAHLVTRAIEEGVAYLDRCDLDSLGDAAGGWVLEGRRDGRTVRLETEFIVDASGGGGFLAKHLGLNDVSAAAGDELQTGLVFGHFSGVGSFADAATGHGASLPDGPYPEERAAIHHLLEEGWLYVLPFDDGVVSAGLVLDHAHPATDGLLRLDPEVAWRRVLRGYPTLERQFAKAEAVEGVHTVPRLQRRLSRVSGPGWALLPHTFCFESPMFSTGIAWSLLAAERLARLLASHPRPAQDEFGLQAYDSLLTAEADALRRLIRPAYRLRDDFEAFAAWTQLYFAAASYSEASQRLCPAPPSAHWSDIGFLGATDPILHAALESAREVLLGPGRTASAHEVVARLIAPRNVAGLCAPERQGSYPVDLDALVASRDLLGLSSEQVTAALPRLRGHVARVDRIRDSGVRL